MELVNTSLVFLAVRDNSVVGGGKYPRMASRTVRRRRKLSSALQSTKGYGGKKGGRDKEEFLEMRTCFSFKYQKSWFGSF